MLPLHPIVASFPAVILVIIFLTELVAYFGETNSWRVFSTFLACLLVIFSGATYYSGFYDAEKANMTFQISEEIISAHQASAKLFLMSLIPTVLFSIIRAIKPNEIIHWLYTPCLILSLILSGVTSHKGGQLVFIHGASVEAVPTTQAKQENVAVEEETPGVVDDKTKEVAVKKPAKKR